MGSRISNAIGLFVIQCFLLFLTVACNDEGTSIGPTCQPSNASPEDLVGAWVISSIDTVAQNTPMDSEFTFFSTGSYDWYFTIVSPSWNADLRDVGSYSLDGSNLLIEGQFARSIIGANTVELQFCNNNTKFRFMDADDRKWTYVKQ